jgi:nitrite reductase/ring-hydroxylating ferredoxin subunit
MPTLEATIEHAKPAVIPTAPPDQKYFKLFRDYTDKEALLKEVRSAFLDGIEAFGGPECRRRVEDAGLEYLHLHYPAEYVNLLEAFVDHRLRRRMIQWSAEVGRNDIGFTDDFLVQELLVVRVHYPHSFIGKRPSLEIKPRLSHRVRYGLASHIERFKEAYDSKTSWRLPFQMLEYLRERRKRAALPLPYRCHAPHLDSWLGQPITSLSVWLAIAGVDVDNSMCMYPDIIGTRLPVSGSRFLGNGVCLPKPMRPDIRDGDLFVFSTEILHSSQVNVSDKTRIALTTRIDSGRPVVFSKESLWFVERWYSAKGILSEGRWRRKRIRGVENSIDRPGTVTARPCHQTVKIRSSFNVKGVYDVAPSDSIREGEKLVAEFENNQRILIMRTREGLKAFTARCPHAGYRMDEGYSDDCVLTCPGHGLEFSLENGQSRLNRYRLAMYKVSEVRGRIYLGDVSSPASA